MYTYISVRARARVYVKVVLQSVFLSYTSIHVNIQSSKFQRTQVGIKIYPHTAPEHYTQHHKHCSLLLCACDTVCNFVLQLSSVIVEKYSNFIERNRKFFPQSLLQTIVQISFYGEK